MTWWTRYHDYLRSDAWRSLRRRILRRAHGLCQRCGRAKAEHVHHLTYDRVGAERLEDLLALCFPCHQTIHSAPRLDADRDAAAETGVHKLTEEERAMPQFTISERFLHPEGTFPAQLVGWEEKSGQYGPQIRWEFETNEQKDDGTPARLAYFTSCNFSTDPRSKIGKLLAAVNVPMPATPEEAAAFDPEKLIGKTCRVRVAHEPSRDGTVWANIESLVSTRTKPSGGSPLPQTPEEAAAAGGPDPFADEK